MTPSLIAAFVGITTPGYWDLEGDDDEVWMLDVGQFLRLCVLFDARPSVLLGAGCEANSPLDELRDEFGHLRLPAFLLSKFDDMDQMGDAIGWETDALKTWLTDDHFGEMPLPALQDMCAYLSLDLALMLDQCWHALGK